MQSGPLQQPEVASLSRETEILPLIFASELSATHHFTLTDIKHALKNDYLIQIMQFEY